MEDGVGSGQWAVGSKMPGPAAPFSSHGLVPSGGRAAVVFTADCPLPTAHYFVLANPSQADVFRSISENVGDSDSSGASLPVLVLIGAAVLMLMALFSLRRKREATPKPLNHQGKLLKELAKRVPLRAAEVRQLKLLAEATQTARQDLAGEESGDEPEEGADGTGGAAIDNPLVFVLCPSLLSEAMRAKPAKVDRKVIAGLARKLGMVWRK